MRDYCYIGNAMTPNVCFWAKIIKGEPSSGNAAAAAAAAAECCMRDYARREKYLFRFSRGGRKKGLILIVIRTIHVQSSRISILQ